MQGVLSPRLAALLATSAALLAWLTPAPAMQPVPKLSKEAALGAQIFVDPSLSGSGAMSCATCHSPTHAYGPPNGRPVQLGGVGLNQEGARAVPTLRYTLPHTPVWSQEYINNPAERILEGVEPPTGGFGWDGRFDTLHAQAAFPLLAPNEMANKSPADFATRLSHTPYASQFRAVFGETIFANPTATFESARMAIERFELEAPTFRPFTSRFDAYLDGQASLSPTEQRGLALFNDPKGGNCAACHLDRKGADGSHPIFTDFQFEALGVPRNRALQATQNLTYYDEGLCGPLRTDQKTHPEYCGLFKTPTLRNVATRAVFFHNGAFHSLRAALEFYVRRDTSPAEWYPTGKDGSVIEFDDLPPALHGNIDVIDAPLTYKQGDKPVWSEAQITDVIAFLKTLTDQDALNVSP